MADIIVGSRVHTSIQIAAPMTDTDKPGLVPVGSSFALNGANSPDAINGVGVTRGVDAEVFKAWLQAQKDMQAPLADMVFEMSEDAAKQVAPPVIPSLVNPEHFGFEPALQRMTSGDSAGAAAEGSTVKHEGPVTSTEMAATSDTSNDDTPRGDPDLVPVKRSQKPATATVDPVGDATKPTS